MFFSTSGYDTNLYVLVTIGLVPNNYNNNKLWLNMQKKLPYIVYV